MEVQEKDYLQAFTLTNVFENGKSKQCILQLQEHPAYKKEFRISAHQVVEAKLFVIDDGYQSTMLLAKEY